MTATYIKGLDNLQERIAQLDAAKMKFVVVSSSDVDQKPKGERVYVIYVCEKD